MYHGFTKLTYLYQTRVTYLVNCSVLFKYYNSIQFTHCVRTITYILVSYTVYTRAYLYNII